MNVRNWIGQPTTGAGMATLLATVSGLASGGMSVTQAIPLAIGAFVGLIWPENSQLQVAAKDLAEGTELMAQAYGAGSTSISKSDAAGS